jgi:hypothetical protein
MKTMKLALAAAAACSALALSAAPASAAVNLVTNGSFETPAGSVGAAGYTTFSAGSEPAGFGWDVTTNSVDLVTYAGPYGAAPPTASSGAVFLDLVGTGSTGGISQTVSGLTAGKSYYLEFDYTNNFHSIGEAAATATIGNLVATKSSSSGTFAHYSGTFTANTASELLTFTNTIGGGNGGLFIDNVSVSAVPEPASWALMMLGVFGLGGLLRTQRRKQGFAALA